MMDSSTVPQPIRAVIYCRVSSEDQKIRLTILTQLEDLRRRIATDPARVLVAEYIDDGVTGTVPMEARPEGWRLLADARRMLFDEAWVFKLDRIGRDGIDPLVVRRELQRLGVKLCSLHDHVEGDLEYSIRVAIAAEERRTLMIRTAAGMARAARDGRYCGGIVPIGYKVEGKKPEVRLAVSDDPMWRTWTESDVVRQIFGWSAFDCWSCRHIADHLNSLGVPTAYQQAGRSVRKKRTRGEWTPGRIRTILVSTVYRGLYQYGKRSKGGRPVIEAPVPAIVSEEIWDAAQGTLARNSYRPKVARNVFLLKSVIRCGSCGLTFSGTMGRGVVWYRCNGQIAYRRKGRGKCDAKSLDGRVVDPLVWNDIVRWLDDPGDIVEQLVSEQNANGAAALREAERIVLHAGLDDIAGQRDRIIDLFRRKRITSEECDTQMDSIAEEAERLRRDLAEIEAPVTEPTVLIASEVIEEIRRRVALGLTDSQRQEIAALLVKRITVNTKLVDGKKQASVVVEYNFVVAPTGTGTRAGKNYTKLQRVVQL